MKLTAGEFISKAEGLKSHELSLKHKIETLSAKYSDIQESIDAEYYQIESLEDQIAALEAEECYSEDDEDGGVDNSAEIAMLQARISVSYQHISHYESELQQAENDLNEASQELSKVEDEEADTLSEIQDSASRTQNNMSILSGIGGDYGSVAGQAVSSSQHVLGQLSQAATILGGSVSVGAGFGGSRGGSNSTASSKSATNDGASRNLYEAAENQRHGMGKKSSTGSASRSGMGTMHGKKGHISSPVSESEERTPKKSGLGKKNTGKGSNTNQTVPHTFNDYLNPENYDANGHYTGDYRPPSLQTAQAAHDFQEWEKNGGMNLPHQDLCKGGESGKKTMVAAENIFDVFDADSPNFWSGRWSDREAFISMAQHIPLVRKHLASGKSLDSIVSMGGTLGACAQHYFQNPIRVMKAGDAYIHCNDGRHRTVAAQIAKVEMPVTIVQEYHLNGTAPSQLNPKSSSNNASEIYENPNYKNCPKENGKWVSEDGKEGERGESKWVPDRDYVPNKSNSNPNHLTWGQILDKYGIDGIRYINGEPQFDKLIKDEVTIDNFTADRFDNFDQADQKLADKLGVEKDVVTNWRESNKYTWHECRDMQTMQLVPRIVHSNVSHRGGVSEAKGV